MPNKESAKKELRKADRKRDHNKKIKENLKKALKSSRKAIEGKDEKAKDLVFNALKQLDKAAQKGVINKNKKNRTKSRLHKKLNKK